MNSLHGRTKRARKTPLSVQVAGELTAIIAREYTPGMLLPPERELCEHFGVSRTVIREALKILATQGVVTIKPGKGVLVAGLSDQPVLDYLDLILQRQHASLDQLLELRRILEVETAALAAQRSTPEDLEAMVRALEIQRTHPDLPEGYCDADVEFHWSLMQAAHNPLLPMVLQPISDLLRASRIASFCGPAAVERTVREHATILDCIVRRDANGARAAMKIHLDHTESDLREASNRSVGEACQECDGYV